MDISFAVCVFFCTVTDFSAEDKASGVKFCMTVHRRSRQRMTNFCELYSPKSPKSDESAWPARWPIRATEMRRSWNIARRVDAGWACVDIRPSPKMDVLFIIIITSLWWVDEILRSACMYVSLSVCLSTRISQKPHDSEGFTIYITRPHLMQPIPTDVERSVICLSVCVYVGHTGLLCKIDWTDRDAVWRNDTLGSK